MRGDSRKNSVRRQEGKGQRSKLRSGQEEDSSIVTTDVILYHLSICYSFIPKFTVIYNRSEIQCFDKDTFERVRIRQFGIACLSVCFFTIQHVSDTSIEGPVRRLTK